MHDLTTGRPAGLILRFATPMLLGNVFQQLYNVTDSIIVGRFLGKEALAAVGASFPLIFMLVSFIIGIASGSTIIIAQYFGAKDMAKVRRSMDTMYIFLFFASLLVGILGIAFSEPIFRLIRLPEEVIPQAALYMQVYFTGILFFFGFNGTSAVLRGLGDSKTPLYFLIISTLTNIVFDLLFVVVFKWGIAGAAMATVLSQAGAFVTLVIYLNKKHPLINLSWRKLAWDREVFRESIRIGVPTGFQQTFVSLGMLALLRIVNDFGTDTVAAYSVAGRIDGLASLPAMNFGQALSTYTGQNIGARKINRVGEGLRATLRMSSVVAVVTSLIIMIFREPLMTLFTSDPEVIQIGARYLLIVGGFYVLFSSMFVIGGVMRGAGDTIVPMFITLLSLWLFRIPLAAILSRSIGVDGIWWAIPIAWFMGMTLSFLYYRTGKWKTKTVVKFRKGH
ncbi:putative efflux protein, MATE family [Lentimicrobium saccharophilum]|uniref:Multidrug-efflux transporter n=1 Tax=Lentimicrobium saccharophilum TaxID=1678841 RepID=A0A0S7C3F8_9BACT|nr:MATE family efflux transporter [Lentimicrobium saccharophilum]GAP43311.1 putative efflux protein, MATE family [Lentimicrobium saccharophilum]